MHQLIAKRSKNILRVLSVFLLLALSEPVWAAGPPEPSVFSNPLALTFIVLMLLLLIIIGILGYILLGAADLRIKKEKKNKAHTVIASLIFFLLLSSSSLFAQDAGTTGQAQTAAASIAGLAPTTFYVMVAIIFLELLVIITLLLNIRFLLKTEKEKVAEPVVETAEAIEAKKNRLSWWDRFNKLKPVSQEADLDLGHDYDGIRELNNRLPPWWLYGFYVSIIFAVIYLWRFHVSHTGPSSAEEYETAVAKAEIKVKEYLKAKGDNVDENNVEFLSGKEDLDAGKSLFTNGACVGCHGNDGSGIVMGQPGVGPNLTDNYWLHGGSIKNIFTTIKYGVNGKGMQAWESVYTPKQIAQLASFVKTLKETKPAQVKDPQGELYIEQDTKPATDSIKATTDTLKAKENKMALN